MAKTLGNHIGEVCVQEVEPLDIVPGLDLWPGKDNDQVIFEGLS